MNAIHRQFALRGPYRYPTGFALLALLLRACIPLGYMPGNLLAGEFMVLCPVGLPPQAAMSIAHAHHGDESMVDADSACPIGSALQFASLPVDVVIALPRLRFNESPSKDVSTLPLGRPTRPFKARAPPANHV